MLLKYRYTILISRLWSGRHFPESSHVVDSTLFHIALCANQFRVWNRYHIITGDPLHSRALAHSRAPLFTQPCPNCSHSRAPGEQWARLCVFTLQGCVQAARLCRGSPVIMTPVYVSVIYFILFYFIFFLRSFPSETSPEHFNRVFSTCAVRKTKTLETEWMLVVDWLIFGHGVFPAVKSNRVENAPCDVTRENLLNIIHTHQIKKDKRN